MKTDINHTIVHKFREQEPSSRVVQVEMADLPLTLREGFDNRLRVEVERFMEREQGPREAMKRIRED